VISSRLILVNALLAILPPTRMFGLKRALVRFAGASVGRGAKICSGTRIHMSGELTIGANTWFGLYGKIIGGASPVRIGADCDIGPQVLICTGTHEINPGEGRAAGAGRSAPIRIEDGVWIGARATILGGTTLGKGAIVAAGALVNRDIEPGSIVAGVPARVVGMRHDHA